MKASERIRYGTPEHPWCDEPETKKMLKAASRKEWKQLIWDTFFGASILIQLCAGSILGILIGIALGLIYIGLFR
jgi:hypothetical protein